jgi:hypothetical protein
MWVRIVLRERLQLLEIDLGGDGVQKTIFVSGRGHQTELSHGVTMVEPTQQTAGRRWITDSAIPSFIPQLIISTLGATLRGVVLR